MFLYFYIFIFVFGLCVGSFLNTVIYRLKTGESILFLRSHCPSCKHTLGFFDLIPLFSFIFLGGRCRYCKKKISWQYPMVELATGILFVLFSYLAKLPSHLTMEQLSLEWFFVGLTLNFFFVSILIIIFVYDLKHSIIPDKVVWFGIAVLLILNGLALLVQLLFINKPDSILPFLNRLLAAALAGGFFLILVLISREKWMGWGDVKLGILIGLILGWPNILVALFLAFVSGAIVGGGLVLAKKKTLKSQIPFGPFLCGSCIVAMLVGEKILDWYLGLLG